MGNESRRRSRSSDLFPTGPILPVDDDEATELVSMPRQRSRMVLVFAACAGAGTVVAVALLVLGLRNTEERAEDGLTLYQVAVELHEAGESTSALGALRRARAVAKTPRAMRQIRQLEFDIRTAPLLRRAQLRLEAQKYEEARVLLAAVLKRDPANQRALLLSRLLPADASAMGIQRSASPAMRPSGKGGSTLENASKVAAGRSVPASGDPSTAPPAGGAEVRLIQ